MKINNHAIATIENPELVRPQSRRSGKRRIDLTDLSYLRFLSVLTNQPLGKVAAAMARRWDGR